MGAVTGVTGASGVLVLIPIITTFFDIPLHVVLGTSLFVDVIASISVSFSYYRAKNVAIKSAVWLIIGALIGAQIGSYFVVSISRSFILFIIAVCMVFFGFKMLKNGSSKNQNTGLLVPEKVSKYLQNPTSLIIMGLVMGVITGIFGAGGGLTVFIILYSVMRYDIKKAVGTSSVVMLLTALSGTIGYYQNGNIDLQLGLIMGISAAVGGALTSTFANRINEKVLARIIGAFFIFFAVLMIILKVVPTIFDINF